jgi:hypothetical protein
MFYDLCHVYINILDYVNEDIKDTLNDFRGHVQSHAVNEVGRSMIRAAGRWLECRRHPLQQVLLAWGSSDIQSNLRTVQNLEIQAWFGSYNALNAEIRSIIKWHQDGFSDCKGRLKARYDNTLEYVIAQAVEIVPQGLMV